MSQKLNKYPFIYDIEIYKNLFFVAFLNTETEEYITFELSPRKNEKIELISFLKNNVSELIGYNNYFFDYPLLHYFFSIININSTKEIVGLLKQKANELISNNDFPYKNVIKQPFITQIDLMKINRWNKVGVSLKQLEFNLQMYNIQELPIPHDAILSLDDIQIVVEYCKNDIEATYKLYLKYKKEIEFRKTLVELYKSPEMLNYDDVKIGEEIFTIKLCEALKLNRKEIGKTFHESIKFKDCIFDYIKFSTNKYKALLEFLKQQEITTLKKAFIEIPFENLTLLEGYYIKQEVKKKQAFLNIEHNSLPVVIGSGGIHYSQENKLIVEDDVYQIVDLDVASFYPNLSIRNRFYPLHLSESFCDIYEDMYEERKQIPKSNPLNTAIKLSLNSVYGKSNSEHGVVTDSAYTLKTTLNGQLLLLMLTEKINREIPDAIDIQYNTDGVTFKIPKTKIEHLRNIVKRWETLTKLEMEEAQYSKMIILNVNNYIAQYTNGKLKRKGCFEYNRNLSQDHSMLIVPKAVEAYFIEGILPEEYIINHSNIFDFFKRTLIKTKGHELWLGQIRNVESKELYKVGERKGTAKMIDKFFKEIKCQKVTRYLVTTSGYTLMKILPPLAGKTEIRESNVESEQLIIECNYLTEEKINNLWKNINYDYYIKEAYKLINPILNNE